MRHRRPRRPSMHGPLWLLNGLCMVVWLYGNDVNKKENSLSRSSSSIISDIILGREDFRRESHFFVRPSVQLIRGTRTKFRHVRRTDIKASFERLVDHRANIIKNIPLSSQQTNMKVTPSILLANGISRSLTRATFSTNTALNSAAAEKAGHPEFYKVPDVWAYNEETMKPAHGSNLPTSGAQTDKELPRGEHEIQLYGLATPNGMKVSIFLEELSDLKGVDYDAWFINIGQGDQFTSGFVDVNPNSKIPAIFDQSNGARVFESGAILLYLAEKYDEFLPKDPALKAECMSWVFFQVGAGPHYGGGGLSHFKNGGAPMNW